jgi:lipoprotein signal peptidase
VLSVKKKKKLRLVSGLFLILVVWLFHNFLVSWLGIDIRNEGISFGWSGFLVILLNLILLVWLTWFGWRSNFFGVELILTGGWVNIIDRMLFGYVRDYWWLGPVYNNIADWMISVGVGIFIWELWKKKLK